LASLGEIRQSLRNATLEAYLAEYKELSETWRSLETKAQGNIAVAGIFIAGSLAYLEKLNPQLRTNEEVFLLIAIGCLIISVILSILVLKTQTITPPPLGSFVDHFTTDLLRLNILASLQTYRSTFFADHVDQWRTVLSEIRESNELKAERLWGAQQFLIAAILAVAALSLSKLID
jgi:hypothetical protein